MLTDLGIDDNFMKDLGQELQPGGSVVFILLKEMTGDKVLERLEEFHAKGKVLQTSSSKDNETALLKVIEAPRPVEES